ncbi:hypothetical protein POKO110462_13930 [Pontibacter korlensis]|uniref:hypothetical protein n=1 Tax=Pontibacter korlensis TaxID=400092 RepID=UPI000A494F1F|nr:hypothetical protein [Pontibacter korlensis]
MKILIVLAASMFGFGFAVQETYRVPQQTKVVALQPLSPAYEEPVMDVMLDTVEITVEAPIAE